MTEIKKKPEASRSTQERAELAALESSYGTDEVVRSNIASGQAARNLQQDVMNEYARDNKRYSLLKGIGDEKAASGAIKEIDKDIRIGKRQVVGEELAALQGGFKDIGNRNVQAIKTGLKGGAAGAALGSFVPGVGTVAGAAVGAGVAAMTVANMRTLMFRSAWAMGVDPKKYKAALRGSLKANQDK